MDEFLKDIKILYYDHYRDCYICVANMKTGQKKYFSACAPSDGSVCEPIPLSMLSPGAQLYFGGYV